MTTAEEENYLRSSFLLLKGGTFAARKVVIREEQKEIQKSGRDLDDLLKDNKGRLEHEFRNYKHREKLFPADGKTKVEDWDISLLTGVLRIVFRLTLSEDERKAVRSIKLQRNDVYAHRATADLSCDDYSDVCDELKEALRNLTSEFSEGVKTECEDIISSCLNGPIDIKSHIEHLKRVSDTDNMFRTILEKIDKNGKETMENIKEVVGQQHVSLKKDIAEDISNSQDVICRTVRDTQLTKADFTTLVRDAVQQALQEQRSTRKVKVVDSELEVSGKDVDKPNIDLAEQMIKTVTNEAIRRTQTSEELVDIREAIQEILDEIASRSGVKALEADIACVVIRFSYETYEQLLKLLEYLDSDDIKLRLAKLAALLSHHLQIKAQLHLSTSLSIKCLQNILDELETESRSEYKRTVRLPIQFESVEGMAHVWNYFENGGATNSLNKLSEALSAKLGTKIKLTSSLNVDQFKSALDDFGSENTSTRLTDQLRVGDDTTQSVDEDNQVSDTDNETASCVDLTDTKSNESQKNIGGIELYSSISGLAPRKLYELQNILDSNPDDTNWWALANVVHKKYNIRPYLMDGFKREGSASSALLKHLQEQGMTVKELQDYLNEIGVKFCLEDELHGRRSSISIKTCHGEEGSEVRLEADPEDDGNAQSKHQLLFSDIEKIEDMLDALQLADHYGVLIDNLETLDEVKKALYLHFQNEEGKKAVTSFPHVFKDTTYRSRELRSIMTKFLDIIHKKGPYKIASQLVEEMLKTDGTSENITDDCETNIDGQNCAIIFAGDPSAETSCILNLVLGEDLLPLDDCFSPPCTVIRYSPQRSVRVVHAHGEPDVLHDLDGEVIKRLRKTTQIMDHLELTLPHPILQSGVILIDDTSLFDLDLEFLLTHTLKQTAVLGLVYVSWIDSVGSIQDRVCGLLTILDRPVSPESDNYFHTSFDPKSALFVFNHLDRIPKKHIDFVKVHAIGKLLKYWPSFEESQVVFCSMLKTHQDGNFDKQLLVKLNNLFTSAVQILTKQSYKWMEKVIKQTTHYLVTTVRLLYMTENDRRRECEVLERQLNNLNDKLSVFRKLKENGNVVFVKLNEYIRSKPCEQILTQSWSIKEIPSFDSEVVTFQWPTIWMGIRKAFYDKLNECIEKWYIEERSISTFEEELRVTKNDLEKELKSIEKEMHSDMAHKVMELSESLLPPVPDKMSVLLHWKRVWGTKLFGRQMDHSVKEIEMKISEYTADPLKFAETIAMEMYQGLLCQFSQIESELIFSEGKRTGLQQIPLVEHFAKCFVEYIDALEERLLDIIMANCKLLNQLGGTAEEYRRDKQQYENMMWSMITLQNSLMEYNEKVSDSDICSGPKVIRFKSPTHIVTTINKSEEERESDEHLQGHGLMSYVTANKDVGYSRDTKEVDFQWQKSSKIGEGRFGKVYSVVNVRRGELITMKEMIFALSDEQYHINDIIDAVKILEGVNHPNLVKYYGVEVHKPKVLVFMEYCDGGTIDQVSREGLTEDRIRVYTKELLTAVQVLHDNNIVHRDIKGTNIYLTSSGCLKLGHLTCAVKLKSQTTNEMDKLVGTIAYMAPEVITQTCKEKHIRASDIWSVGCVVIEMATGKPPWHELGNNFEIMFRVGTGETPPTPENFCDAGKDFLSHCLEREPDKRWTASQLKDHPFAKVFSKCKTTDEESDDDCDDVDDDYYDYNDDQDVEAQAEVKSETPEKGESDQEDERFFGGKTNPAAFQRLVKDLRNMKKDAHKFGIEGTPRGDNLFIWDVKLTGFPADTTLGRDIRNWAEKHKREPVVYLEMQFPDEYPMAPPFVRVTRPRFKFFSGHVTIGGSICMETLTKSGWTPTNDLQSILAEIRSEIMGDPNIRLDSNPDREYGEAEARDAFNRMVNRYDWNK